ncbi:MAG: arsenite methyltransferase [Actinomycetota bacterium]|nr:arsenite methyltransferase [Actinomycetota bacterium]
MGDVREEVRARYAQAAVSVRKGGQQGCGCGCCGGEDGCCCGDVGLFGAGLYEEAQRRGLPQAALLSSLGCGNPTAVAELGEGEVVLDLGSGGGIDVLLSARRVGPSGKVYGLDMTEEMLALARENAREAGIANVEFLEGYIEAIPLPAATVDVIISNCVINLAADKGEVFGEMHRVLRPGGRLGITDVVAADHLTPEERAERGSYAGCIAGTLSFAEYREGLQGAGFEEVSVTPTHEVADRFFGAIIRGTKVGPRTSGSGGPPRATPA